MRLLVTVLLTFYISISYGQVDSLMQVGREFAMKRDFNNATLYFKKAYSISTSNENKGKTMNNIGLLHYLQKDYLSAIKYYDIALKHYQQDKNKEAASQTLINMGGSYRLLNRTCKALECYQKSFEQSKSSQTKVSALNNIGRLSFTTGDYTEGITYFKKLAEGDLKIYQIYQNLARLYANINDIESAVENYQKALNIHENQYSPVAIDLNKEIADLYYSRNNKELAIKYYNTAIHSYERLRDLYLIDQTKLNSSVMVRDIYTSAIECAAKISNQDLANYYLEQLKAPVLSFKIRENLLPDSVKVELKELDHKINQALKNELEDLDKLVTEKGKLLQQFPVPGQRNYKEVLEVLPEDMAVLNYSYSDSLLVRTISTGTNTQIDLTRINEHFQNRINDFYLNASDRSKDSFNDYNSFFKASKYLYSILVPEISQNIKRVLIIPYGKLYQVPFTCLTNSDPSMDWASFSDTKYLIEKYAISYSSSLSTIQSSKYGSRSAIAFIPEYSDKKQLKFAENEFKALDKYFNAEVLQDEDASKENFFRELPEHDIISVIGHGLTGKILLQNDTIHSEDLYQLNLDNSLTVLSACESNTGSIKMNEGYMSMARKFIEAGSSSVIASLWRVNDKVTSEIMSDFYWYYSEGNAKDQALQKAMRNHLNNADSELRAPVFWSGLTLLGNPEALPESRSQYLWLFLLLLLIPFAKYLKR
ncbi:hypothetical protein DF185_19750 [Marinifilum breve]|uniref:CHAT domain-containing protein n=1 Tax=Marinifilum breve TaxID=2184082 RepID=A0A2V3ZWD1_9BACT|nr:CHAT domain-containing tetratricopeptide repeat protein [Marinifilum breve]PXX96876.1 hypothetical protein DF185_19750 [Marinifilum breve]